MKGTSIGEFEEMCLLCVGILSPEAYGVSVQAEIKTRSGRSMTISSIHSTLIRLEKKGLLKSAMGGATESRGGRAKRFFHLTLEGKKAILTVRDLRENMWKDITQIGWESL